MKQCASSEFEKMERDRKELPITAIRAPLLAALQVSQSPAPA